MARANKLLYQSKATMEVINSQFKAKVPVKNKTLGFTHGKPQTPHHTGINRQPIHNE